MDESLRRDARRAYERGRLLRALPWALAPIALAAVAMLSASASVSAAVSLGALGALSAAAARWRGGELGRMTPWALALGALGFALTRSSVIGACATGCQVDDVKVALLCGVVGLGLGVALGFVARHRDLHGLLGGVALAGALAALGCAAAGVGAGIGLLAAIGLGAAPLVVFRRRTSR